MKSKTSNEIKKFLETCINLRPEDLIIDDLSWKYLCRSVLRGENIFITGPARSGKTKAAIAVAICKAASMVNNINVKVSFRTTCIINAAVSLPYIVLAYDSTKDKFNKVKQLFPFLSSSGCTPEGLAYEATMKHFIKNNLGEDDYYLLNMSDGEPYYNYSAAIKEICYVGEPAVLHTREQVNKIRASGVKIMSYYITETQNDLNLKQFKAMYGKDSRIINVSNVNEIAKTMNELFLSKS